MISQFPRFCFFLFCVVLPTHLWAQNHNECPPEGEPPEEWVCSGYWNTEYCEWAENPTYPEACNICEQPDPALTGCCAEVPFDEDDYKCCGGQIVDINAECCDDGTVAGSGQVCCGSEGSTTATDLDDCCGGAILEEGQECCGGAVLQQGESCCGGEPVTLETWEICCNGEVIERNDRWECSITTVPLWIVSAAPLQGYPGQTIEVVITYTPLPGIKILTDSCGELNPVGPLEVPSNSGGGTITKTVTLPMTIGDTVTVNVDSRTGTFTNCEGSSEDFTGLSTSTVTVTVVPDCESRQQEKWADISGDFITEESAARVPTELCNNGSTKRDARVRRFFQAEGKYQRYVYGPGENGSDECSPPTAGTLVSGTRRKKTDNPEAPTETLPPVRVEFFDHQGYSCDTGEPDDDCELTEQFCAQTGQILDSTACKCIDPCDLPKEEDKGVAEITGDVVLKNLQYNADATAFAQAISEQSVTPIQIAGAGTDVIRFVDVYVPKTTDPEFTDPAILAVTSSTELRVNAKIITINDAPARDLEGSLKLTLDSGTASDVALFYYSEQAGMYVPYTVGTNIALLAEGHEGCGIHLGHDDYVVFKVLVKSGGPFKFTATVIPDLGSSAITAKVQFLEKFMTQRVDRDDPTKNWANTVTYRGTAYAGDESGDMFAWTLGYSFPSGTIYTWSAVSRENETIAGPADVGVNYWRVSNGGNDLISTWLDWKPSEYQVSVTATLPDGQEITLSSPQEIGWRTGDWMVVGQVVPVTDLTIGNSEEQSLRIALITELLFGGAYPFPGQPPVDLGLFSTETISFLWLAYHGTFDSQPPAQVSLTDQSVSPPITIPLNSKHWLLQQALSANPDVYELSDLMTETQAWDLYEEKQYRMYTRYYYRFTVGVGGLVKNVAPIKSPHCDIGPTKFIAPPGGAVGEFFGWFMELGMVVGDMPSKLDDFTETSQLFIAAETSPHNGIYLDYSGVSMYNSGRLGLEGRLPGYALLGRDAPFIHTEVSSLVEYEGDVTDRIDLSVNRSFSFPEGSSSGTNQFNEITVYKFRRTPGGGRYERVAFYPIGQNAGQLVPFLNSGPTAWPGLPSLPQRGIGQIDFIPITN